MACTGPVGSATPDSLRIRRLDWVRLPLSVAARRIIRPNEWPHRPGFAGVAGRGSACLVRLQSEHEDCRSSLSSCSGFVSGLRLLGGARPSFAGDAQRRNRLSGSRSRFLTFSLDLKQFDRAAEFQAFDMYPQFAEGFEPGYVTLEAADPVFRCHHQAFLSAP